MNLKVDVASVESALKLKLEEGLVPRGQVSGMRKRQSCGDARGQVSGICLN